MLALSPAPSGLASWAGSFRYEFLMQVRRPAVWTASAITALLLLGILLSSRLEALRMPMSGTLQMAAVAVGSISYFLPIVYGILLADRTPREKHLNTLELLDSLPVSASSRLWGKYLGAVAATTLPIFAGYLLVLAALAARLDRLDLLSAFLPVFALQVLPGLLFVGAFSIACTELIPVPLYAVLFTGYWFWGNVVAPSRVPTVACTPLTPIGKYAAIAFFGGSHNECGLGPGSLGAAAGIGSIALLLATGALAIVAVQLYVSRSAARR